MSAIAMIGRAAHGWEADLSTTSENVDMRSFETMYDNVCRDGNNNPNGERH